MKFICPICKGEIISWREKVMLHEQKINAKTGRLAKTVKKFDILVDGAYGIKCKECLWEYNMNSCCDISGTLSDEELELVEEIVENINKN